MTIAASDDGLAIATAGLTKRFKSGQVAVDHIDLAVPAGAVYGFLGPNGSGKTTTIRMLLGLISPTNGQARVLGEPMPGGQGRVLPHVGALVEGPAFHQHLSGRDNLVRLDSADAAASPHQQHQRITEALERVGLAAAAGKRYRHYSLGMRQRLGLAAALLRPRRVMILDEPTNGLDPQGTREVRHLIAELAAGGTTVLVSSHLLGEVEQVCSHVGIMNHGQLLAQGTLAEVEGRAGAKVRVLVPAPDAARAVAVLQQVGVGQVGAQVLGEAARIDGELGRVDLAQVAPALVGAGIALLGLSGGSRKLEDVFVELTGEGFDVAR